MKKINTYSVKNWSDIPTVWKNTKEVNKVKYTNSPFDKELLNMLSPIAGDDNLRPIMSGVNFDDFGITVTNAHVLVSIPEPNEKYKGTYATIPKKEYTIGKGSGVEIKNNMFVSPKYPQYKEIIRGSKKSDRVQKINVYKLLQWTYVALKYCNKGSFTVFYWMGDTSMAFNANYVIDSMKLLLKLGYSEVYCFTSEGNKAAIFSPDKDYELGKSLILLLMPVMIDDKIYKIEDIKGGSFDLDFSRELLAYYDFSTDEIRNSNDSVAEFKMFYGDYDVLPQNEIKMLNKFAEKNTYPILDFFAVRNNHIHASDLASSLLIKHTDLEDGLYDVLDSAIELNEEMNSDEYPLAIKIEEPKIKFIIESDVLYHYISVALKFVSKDDLRPQLTGMFFDYKDGKMFIVGTNAHILCKIDITKYIEVNKDQIDFSFIVSANNLTKFFNNIESSVVIVSADKNNVSFENEKYTFTSRLIDAKYSNYEGVISNFNEKKLNLSKKELLDCINSDEAKKFIKDHKKEQIIIFDELSNEGRLDIYLGISDIYRRETNPPITEKVKVGNISYSNEEGTFQIIDSTLLIMPMAIENVNLFAFDVKYLSSILDALNCDSFDLLYRATNRGYFITGSCLNYGTVVKPVSVYKEVVQEVVKVSSKASEIEELETLIELLKEVVSENPKDLDSKDVLELYEENLIELKKVNAEKFEKGGRVGCGCNHSFDKGGEIKNKLLAPNGKKSNLTPEQYKLVRSKNFKKWFGDWENDPENSSKVLDENGEPLVVYHGSYADYNIFKARYDNRGVALIYFTSKENVARQYGELVKSYFLNIKELSYIDGNNMSFNDVYDETMLTTELDYVNKSTEYDFIGLLIEDVFDSPYGKKKGAKSNVYAVKNPVQIKLADGSNIKFDGNNPDIRFENGGEIGKYNKEYEKELYLKYKQEGKELPRLTKVATEDEIKFLHGKSIYKPMTKGDVIYFDEKEYGKKFRGEILDVLNENEFLVSRGIKVFVVNKNDIMGTAPKKEDDLFNVGVSIYDERVSDINSTYFYKTYGVGENPFEVNYEQSNEYGYGIYFLDEKYSGIGKYKESRILAIKPNVKKPLIFLNDDGSSFNSQYKEAYEKAVKYDGVKNKDDFNKKMVELGYDSMLVSDIHGTHLIFFYNDPYLYTLKSDLGH